MRTRPLPYALPVVALFLFSISALAQKITTDWDHGSNFANYHTYAWNEGTPVQDPVTDRRIRDTIDQQLVSKGYQRVEDPTQADVLVTYDAAVGQQVERNTAGMGGWGQGWGMGGQMVASTVDSIPVGSLMVRIGDNKTHKIVWCGTASGILKDRPDRIALEIQRSTAKMFARYPPKP